MEIIFQKAKIIDPFGKHNGKTKDVFIKDGVIEKVGNNIKAGSKAKIYHSEGFCISPGWIDVGCTFGEPGNEHIETLDSLIACAQKGGYTQVLPFANTKPGIHTKSEIEFIKSKSKGKSVLVHPIGFLTKDRKGVEMAEILQMHAAGAVAFSDGPHTISNSGMYQRLLQYLLKIPDACLIHQSLDEQLCAHGLMHEGITSVRLGLQGIPSIAEKIAIQKELDLIGYTGGKVLFQKISSQEGVNLIKRAKKEGLNVYSSVSIFHLIFEDKDLETFDVNLKLWPPLRSDGDRKALLKGLEDDTIDLICSDHCPWDPENKDLEFQSAAFGSINLETAFALSQSFSRLKLPLELWVKKVSFDVRKIFNFPHSHIDEGQFAELTLFHPEKTWQYNSSNSISKNSKFFGQTLRGQVLGTFLKGVLNE